MSGVCVELRRRPPPQRGERKNGPKTAPLRHDRLHHPLKQSPKLSNSRILRGSLQFPMWKVTFLLHFRDRGGRHVPLQFIEQCSPAFEARASTNYALVEEVRAADFSR